MKLNIDHIKQIDAYIGDGQYQKALNFCDVIHETNKNNLTLNKIIAHIYSLMENPLKAIEVLKKFEHTCPNDYDIINNLGHYYLQSEKVKEASLYISKANELNTNQPSSYQNSAELNIILKNFVQAEIDIDKCITLNKKIFKDYDSYLRSIIIKSEILIAQKKINEAVEFFLELTSTKFNGDICARVAEIKPDSISQELVDKAKELIKNSSYISRMDRFNKLVSLYFFLAYFYEKLDRKKSEEYYVKANQEIFDIQRLRMISFQKIFQKQIDVFKKIKGVSITNYESGKKNIFVVGLPRSGTTLLESTLSANEQVFAGGEMKAFNSLYNRMAIEYDDFSEENLNKVGQAYLDIMNPIRGKFDFIVDKMPLNFTHIGFILKCLPSAKIILILRDPWDVATSLYKQRFVKNIPYASSFFNIGVYIANFEAIVNFWLSYQEIKNKIYLIRYEELVQNFDHHQKKIYEYCKIKSPYDSSIREKHFARTASMNQVQKKVNKDSVKKRNFENFQTEFFDSYNSQKEYWKSKGIIFKNAYFGYLQ